MSDCYRLGTATTVPTPHGTQWFMSKVKRSDLSRLPRTSCMASRTDHSLPAVLVIVRTPPAATGFPAKPTNCRENSDCHVLRCPCPSGFHNEPLAFHLRQFVDYCVSREPSLRIVLTPVHTPKEGWWGPGGPTTILTRDFEETINDTNDQSR